MCDPDGELEELPKLRTRVAINVAFAIHRFDEFMMLMIGEGMLQLVIAIGLTANALYLGLQMAGPVLMALLMLSIVMAIVSRIMPGMNTWILAMPLQVVVACLITAVSLPTIMGAFHGWEDQVVRTASTMLRGG